MAFGSTTGGSCVQYDPHYQTRSQQMIQPPYLEDHTLVVHDLADPLDLRKATLISSQGFADVQRWRDQAVAGGDSRKNLGTVFTNSFVRVPEGIEPTYSIPFYLVPVWLNGFFWTRLLCTDAGTIQHLEKYFSLTNRPEVNLFNEI